MQRHTPLFVLSVAFVAPAFLACAQAKEQIKAPPPVAELGPDRVRIDVDFLDDNPIYFGFNDQLLDDPSLSRLGAIATYMEENADTEVTITGHADERGTIEYNLALGDRRGRAARDYLVNLGIAADRVFVVSYGEEAPAAEGGAGEHDPDESVHSLNRRDEFLFFTRLSRTAAR